MLDWLKVGLVIAVCYLASAQADNNQTTDLPDFSLEDYQHDAGNNIGSNSVILQNNNLDQIAQDAVNKKKREEEQKRKEAAQQIQLAKQKALAQQEEAAKKAAQLQQKLEQERRDKIIKYEREHKQYGRREVYDYQSITYTNQVLKRKYGENNKHLSPFISIDEYDRYLFLSAIKDDVALIKELLDKRANINARDSKRYYTPLMYAVEAGANSAADYLLTRGANYRLQAKDGKTALHIAVITGNVQAIKDLLSLGSDPEATDSTGRSPLYYAKSLPAAIKKLLLSKYKDKERALLESIGLQDVSMVQQLLDSGANVNASDTHGNTPIMLAVADGNIPMIALLLQYNPDVGRTNRQSMDALAVAIAKHDEQSWTLIKTFLSKKDLS